MIVVTMFDDDFENENEDNNDEREKGTNRCGVFKCEM